MAKKSRVLNREGHRAGGDTGDAARQQQTRGHIHRSPSSRGDPDVKRPTCLNSQSCFNKWSTCPAENTSANGLELALALLWELSDQLPGAIPVLAVHDDIVIECGSSQAEIASTWLKKAMLDAMAPLIDPVPVEVEVKSASTWGGWPSRQSSGERTQFVVNWGHFQLLEAMGTLASIRRPDRVTDKPRADTAELRLWWREFPSLLYDWGGHGRSSDLLGQCRYSCCQHQRAGA